MKKFIFLGLMILLACGKNASESTALKPEAFHDKLAATPNAVLLDVRTPDEVHAGHIKGMVNFDFSAPEFNTLVMGMDKSKSYFVYCAAGTRSSKAADKMRDLGFSNVYQLDGGINAWKAAGLETVSK